MPSPSDSSQSELNATEETNDQNISKSFNSEDDFAPHFIEGNKFQFEVDISQNRIFEVNRVLSEKRNRDKVKSGWSPLLN